MVQVNQNDHENQNALLDLGGLPYQAVQVTPIFREIQSVQAAQVVLVALAIQNALLDLVTPNVHDAPLAHVQFRYSVLGYCTYKKVYIRKNKEYFMAIFLEEPPLAWHPTSPVMV